MGQKVHPIGFRLGVSRDWASKWYAEGKDYANFIEKDFVIREFIRKKLAHASVSQIQIERPRNGAQITIFTARPGIVIGRKGEDIEVLKQEISQIMGVPTSVNIEEIRRPELDAFLVADGIAKQLERRVMFRRAMKRSVASTMRLGAAGIKISISGRLNGAEIARTEWYREGRVPLHTLRADIDYGFAEAHTTYGVIGVKVWIFRGENLEGLDLQSDGITDSPEERKSRRNNKTRVARKKD
ncbi:30S ribosomal protein S3 [Cardiobacterium valvarum]|uniref:Small ribosomal subunit protein uS3 n=1 Tax=Cardiobacterium valvarum F0432 TaxID=797473 RepID=G9ZCS2_9GAMM|nr:30S ribosomal protein S3 [Cardiobacterium valvarum]EHM55654.1 ribosomal protein S3 [Cardiobacterium valvarum F0432]